MTNAEKASRIRQVKTSRLSNELAASFSTKAVHCIYQAVLLLLSLYPRSRGISLVGPVAAAQVPDNKCSYGDENQTSHDDSSDNPTYSLLRLGPST